jgi:hypothetical protein
VVLTGWLLTAELTAGFAGGFASSRRSGGVVVFDAGVFVLLTGWLLTPELTAGFAGGFASSRRSGGAFVFNSGWAVFVTAALGLAATPLNSGFVFGGFSTTPVS